MCSARLIIRKPGAALYTEVVAAVVSMAIGTQWGFVTLIWGVVQGAAAELGFALFLLHELAARRRARGRRRRGPLHGPARHQLHSIAAQSD